ncbi:Ribosome-recycling factor, mitochondrial [Candida viswanathii]|uniref:Ribosome-recycling factor, mitochondrial n=1 Tax=Candida viswanathii TaxID=5486 RepID=A0A367XZW1_9ASCO|nr:Ribosome-recycling factor, mitochondrial [Candida viswanathii]
MFRSIIKHQRGLLPRVAVPRVTYSPASLTTFHSFHTSPVSNAKRSSKKGKKRQQDEEEEEEEEGRQNAKDASAAQESEPTIDLDHVTKSFETILGKFNKQATDIKLGKMSTKIFDEIDVNVGKRGEDIVVPFTAVGQTNIQGRNYVINLYDEAYGQNVINAIMGSGLNMSGTIDPNNKFQIKVPIPPVTTESKEANAKRLKDVYEMYRNNQKTNSLNSVRAEARHKFQKKLKLKKMTDTQHQILKKLEALHKTYADKLADSFKAAEKSILK